jgi:hypothetical protein
MAFNMTSFFAGVGTVFAAIVVGFAGGAMLTTTSTRVEPNKLERAAASTPAPPPAVTAKAQTPEVPSTSIATAPEAQPAAPSNDAAESPPASDRVASPKPAAISQEAVPSQPAPVMARNDATSQPDAVKKAQDGEVKKAQDGEPSNEAAPKKPERRAERHRERRRHQDVESAANAVRQIQRDDEVRQFPRNDEERPIQRDDRVRLIRRDDGQQDVIVRRYETPRFGFFGDD